MTSVSGGAGSISCDHAGAADKEQTQAVSNKNGIYLARMLIICFTFRLEGSNHTEARIGVADNCRSDLEFHTRDVLSEPHFLFG